ncbi:hypothetical protein BCV72DRAFT_40907 [Rhizopus microsporus var. microsporus]|uniref:Gfd2/YDR514C-like C-terminal domain-containing protein n=2 Tax=Rhizopus microsporus TaxID=58291 RepID=A0A2G4SW62_RHIZD|nr:uncharacterized protein RHIMIDRAFT_127460 [Rhizopus microsporus ATCC 52813]ORE02921.1 hypothetical protein BCV72DRAFT_40907 [Rhizopus microsporus var. microsporus]PHZ13007.1 hypothetical protein RHIMIDRAFT_127460 [Rhizopus microsporus ATCC 52813]
MLVKVLSSVDWNQVYLVWRNYYEQRGYAIAFQTFFHPNNFFAPDSDTFGIPLKLGKTVTDEYMVVMSLQIYKQLAQHFTRQFPDAPLPPSVDELTIHKCEVIEAFTAITDTVLSKHKTKAKKLNKKHEHMRKAKEEAALGKRLVEEGKYVFMAIDLEAYERDHSIILEIGWSIFDSRTRRFMDQHYLIDSYQHLINETFVDDQKLKFDYGTSVWCSLKQALEELKKDLTWAVKRDGGFVLVGHGLISDLKYLRQQKFMWPTVDGGETKDVNNSACVAILNTDTIYGASINDLHNPPSLGKTLDNFGVETWNLHNAGNDAHYTMLLLLILLGYENK